MITLEELLISARFIGIHVLVRTDTEKGFFLHVYRKDPMVTLVQAYSRDINVLINTGYDAVFNYAK